MKPHIRKVCGWWVCRGPNCIEGFSMRDPATAYMWWRRNSGMPDL